MATPDELIRRIDALNESVARNDRDREHFVDLTERLAVVEVTVSSPDGVVTVTAGPGGLVKAVEFTDRINQVEARSLSRTVTELLAQARAEVAQEQERLVVASLGEDTVLQQARAEAQQIFGDQPAEEPEFVPSAELRDDDPGEDTSIFEQRGW